MIDDTKIVSKLKEFANENNISLEDLSGMLRVEATNEINGKIRENVAKNKDLVGKCFYTTVKKPSHMFPEMRKFFLVLSNRSNNEYRVECLTFYEHPTYWFEYNMHKASYPGDFYLGHFEFDGFETDSYLASNIRSYQEISKDEFNLRAKKYLNELLSLNWIEDHYRWGGVFPQDEKWKIHDLKEAIEFDLKDEIEFKKDNK